VTLLALVSSNSRPHSSTPDQPYVIALEEQYAMQLQVLLPLYFGPANNGWDSLFSMLQQYTNLNISVIINPSTGSKASDLSWQYRQGLTTLAGYPNARILGYVNANSGQRSISNIRADIQAYSQWPSAYTPSGVYLDQTVNSQENIMINVVQYARNYPLGQYVVINPQSYQNIPASFYTYSNILVQFDDAYSNWGTFSPASSYIPESAAVIYNVNLPSQSLQKLVTSMSDAGWLALYLTSGDSTFNSFGSNWATICQYIAASSTRAISSVIGRTTLISSLYIASLPQSSITALYSIVSEPVDNSQTQAVLKASTQGPDVASLTSSVLDGASDVFQTISFGNGVASTNLVTTQSMAVSSYQCSMPSTMASQIVLWTSLDTFAFSELLTAESTTLDTIVSTDTASIISLQPAGGEVTPSSSTVVVVCGIFGFLLLAMVSWIWAARQARKKRRQFGVETSMKPLNRRTETHDDLLRNSALSVDGLNLRSAVIYARSLNINRDLGMTVSTKHRSLDTEIREISFLNLDDETRVLYTSHGNLASPQPLSADRQDMTSYTNLSSPEPLSPTQLLQRM